MASKQISAWRSTNPQTKHLKRVAGLEFRSAIKSNSTSPSRNVNGIKVQLGRLCASPWDVQNLESSYSWGTRLVTDTLDVNSTQFMQNSGKIIVKKILPCYQRGKERSEMAKYLEHQTYDNLGLSFQILFFSCRNSWAYIV